MFSICLYIRDNLYDLNPLNRNWCLQVHNTCIQCIVVLIREAVVTALVRVEELSSVENAFLLSAPGRSELPYMLLFPV